MTEPPHPDDADLAMLTIVQSLASPVEQSMGRIMAESLTEMLDDVAPRDRARVLMRLGQLMLTVTEVHPNETQLTWGNAMLIAATKTMEPS